MDKKSPKKFENTHKKVEKTKQEEPRTLDGSYKTFLESDVVDF